MTLSDLYQYGVYAILGLGGLTVAVNAIAAVTPSDKDDKWAKRLSWLNDKLTMFVLPFLRSKLKQLEAPKDGE